MFAQRCTGKGGVKQRGGSRKSRTKSENSNVREQAKRTGECVCVFVHVCLLVCVALLLIGREGHGRFASKTG